MKVAAIGYGAFGPFVIKALKELADVQIIAVAGRDAKVVSKLFPLRGIKFCQVHTKSIECPTYTLTHLASCR